MFKRVVSLLSLIVSLLLFVGVGGIYASWTYANNSPSTTEYDISDLGVIDFAYFSEVVITNISTVSNTVDNENTTCIQPTKVNSTINGSVGEKVVYKINAHNYSETETFVYAGASYNSSIYTSLDNLTISISEDMQGNSLMTGSITDNVYQGNAVKPGEDFVFYVTYTLTNNISQGEILVDYIFKPVIYTVTYMNNNQTFAVEYITNNDGVYSVISQKPENAGLKFAGWVNANAVIVNTIPAKNTYNYTLSASWENRYIIIFADADGNVLYEEQFTDSSTALSTEGQATVDRILAELNEEAQKDDMKVVWSDYNIKGAKADITVKAIYVYNGVLNLVPVYEEPDDGIVDYYKVLAVDSLPAEVVVPGYVNGVPVKMVKRITNEDGDSDWSNWEPTVNTIIIEEGVESLGDKYDSEHNGNALAWTPNLKTVKLPSTIKYLGKNTFSRNSAISSGGYNDKKVLTIEFNGTKAEWKAILANSDKNWDGGLQANSVVQCSDGYFKLEKSGFLGLSLSWKEY